MRSPNKISCRGVFGTRSRSEQCFLSTTLYVGDYRRLATMINDLARWNSRKALCPICWLILVIFKAEGFGKLARAVPGPCWAYLYKSQLITRGRNNNILFANCKVGSHSWWWWWWWWWGPDMKIMNGRLKTNKSQAGDNFLTPQFAHWRPKDQTQDLP